MEVHNAEDHLRGCIPIFYKTDTYLEVTDEVQAVFLADKRAELTLTYGRCIAQGSLLTDCDNGIEKGYCAEHPPTLEEITEDQQLRDQLYSAVMELPDKQAKWLCPVFIQA